MPKSLVNTDRKDYFAPCFSSKGNIGQLENRYIDV